MKYVMMMATTAAMIEQFNKNNILILEKLGYRVHVVANFKKGNPISEGRITAFKKWVVEHNGMYYHVDAVRKLVAPKQHFEVYRFLCGMMKKYQYEFIHCHTPMGSVIARCAAKVMNTRVIYTAHGFLFFRGGPIKWWVIDYPIELFFSKWTDIQIVINREDYKNAKKMLHAKKTIYLPGVGVDYQKVNDCVAKNNKKREELGISESEFVIISVGELHKRKNQIMILEALNYIDLGGLHYVMVGKGPMIGIYKEYIYKHQLQDTVHILGFRDDVFDLYMMSDCMVHPSIREGLGMAPLEAMACGLPLINTYVNGMRDYTSNNITGICMDTFSPIELAKAINQMRSDESFRRNCGNRNKRIAKQFSYVKSNMIMREVYSSFEVQ